MENRLRSLAVRFRELFPAQRRLMLAGCLVAGVLLLIILASNQGLPPVRQTVRTFPPMRAGQNGEIPSPDGIRSTGGDGRMTNTPVPPGLSYELYKAGPVDSAAVFREPRIAYSAELSVVTKEFAHSRASLEEILERHRGYVAKLRLVGQPSGSVLSATLRVPSSEYRSALTELKAVGFVEHEEEAADEITQQHGELEARLINAQNEEQRIQRILQNQPQKFYDSRPLERQVALLRAEIERIEAERSTASSQVAFANVSFSLREERSTPAETVGAKLRAAAVGGLSDAFESISAILLFLAARGPMLALWAVLILLPARFFWRRRSQWGLREAEAPKNS
jgi:uncharacterized small protein (DUF1192 family)